MPQLDTEVSNLSINWVSYNRKKEKFRIPFKLICYANGIEPSYLRKRIYNIPEIQRKLKSIGVLEVLLKLNSEE